MEEAYVVRHRVLVEGVSVRRVAREMGIDRRTVRRYVEGAEPGVRQPAERVAPSQELIRPRVEAILAEAPRWTGGKQRLTVKRLHRMLVDEGFTVAETTVKRVVREWKRQRQECSCR